MLPLTFRLDGLAVLVIGAGEVGMRKAAQLVEAGAEVTVIAEEFRASVPKGVVHLERRRYRRGDLRGFWLVVSATGEAVVNDEIVLEAEAERVWLNVVDDPSRCSFYFMALHRQGEVTVAVTTEGASPALAQEIRELVAERLPANLADVAATLRRERGVLHERGESTEGRDWRGRVRQLLAANSAIEFAESP